MLLALWSGFWDWGGSESVSVDTHDGADYSKYRAKLEKSLKAFQEYENKKHIKEIVKISKKLNIPTVEIQKVIEQNNSQISIEDIKTEVNKILSLILERELEYYRIVQQRELDDELALLLLA